MVLFEHMKELISNWKKTFGELFSNKLEANITKNNFYRIFTKRAFFPVITIFLLEQSTITLPQIALIASASSVFQLFLELPTGIIADKIGHKKSVVIGNFISFLSVIPYLVSPNFVGGLIASLLFFAGGSFVSGSAQALMHDTLRAIGREKEYASISGKGQSFGLIGNIFIVSLVPLTYKFSPFLPFIIGGVFLFFAFLISTSFVQPDTVSESDTKERMIDIKSTLVTFKNLKPSLVIVFVLAGIMAASLDGSGTFREVIFKTVHIPTYIFGIIAGVGSLCAAILGRNIHLLRNMKASTFYCFDAFVAVLVFILVALTKNPVIIIIAFIIGPSYNRIRDIIFESHVFEQYKESTQKATLVSMLGFSGLIMSIGVPLLLSQLVSSYGLFAGHGVFGITLILVAIVLILSFSKLYKKEKFLN